MTCLIGIDVGGTKIAAGLVTLPAGQVLARRLQPTLPKRGGEAVLADVVALARSLQDEATGLNTRPFAIGVGLAELVSPAGIILDEATIRWMGLPVSARIESETSLPVAIEADVRAAARGEAELGAGRGLPSFLYVTVGTGISACLILDGSPYTGALGLAGSFASSRTVIAADSGELVAGPPLERFAGGPALASRLAALLPTFTGAAPDVLALAAAGDNAAISVVDSAGRALGAAIAHLVNVLDPQAIVIGGGLGLAGGRYRSSLEEALRSHIYSDHHRVLPLLNAALGADAGWIGAALAAHRPLKGSHER
jgi:predicted NBD/HSP70 family sugar kinase